MDDFFNASNPFLEYERIIYRLNVGDLIEIDRGSYKHWVICEKIDENGIIWCFHVTRVPIKKRNEKTGFDSMALIRCETLRDILSDNQGLRLSKCRVNNQEKIAQKIMRTEGIKQPDIKNLFEELHKRRDTIIEYDPKHSNCELYATCWKYGIGWTSHSKSYRRLIDIGFGASAGLGTGTVIAATGLTAAGFTSAGIAGGSLAAAWQSSIGNVAAGSAFATLQSLGATGTIAAVGSVALGVTVPIAIAGGAYYYWRHKHSYCKEFTTNKN